MPTTRASSFSCFLVLASAIAASIWPGLNSSAQEPAPAPAADAQPTPAVPQPTETQAIAPTPVESPPPSPPALPPVVEAPAEPVLPNPAFANYGQLVDSEVAKLVELSSEQQEKIKQILAQRDAATQQAAEADHAALDNDAYQQIDAILNDEQRSRLTTITEADTRRLRFSFRFQPWADVLNWFAEQADLSLVLDAPPPGTFNYTDNREYSVSEAIDLLNGVLLTKGYTLLRRERMLMLIDLSGGLPADLVPRLSMAEVSKRGRFEIVSVVFTIGERNAEEVKTEIAPLIGPHGLTAVLPKTKQILVTETAGKMRAIGAVIESIPLPEKPAPPKEEKPAPPSLAVFPLAGLDAKATLEILSVLFSDTKFVHDPNADQIMAQAAAERKAAVEAVLTQLRTDHVAEKKPRLEKHPVKQANRTDLLESLKLSVPGSILRFDTETGELIAWATPEQQAKIRETITQLGQAASPAAERQLEVYAFKSTDPATALALLQKMLPEARLAVDATTKSIIALADADDHRAIRATVDQLEANRPEKPTLKVYALDADQRKRAQAMITALATDLPGIRMVPDAAAGELAVWAQAEQHPIVEDIVKQIQREVPQADRLHVATYRLKVADPASVLSVLQTLMPDVKFVSDAKAKQIVAWAKSADQDKIRETVAQLDADLPDDERLKLMSHPVGNATPETVLVMLKTILPNVQVVSDAKNSALVVLAQRGEQELVRRAIEQSQPNVPEEKRSRIEMYALPDADPVQVASMLSTIFPLGRFTGDRVSAKLAAWATPTEHESIKIVVEGMLKSVPAGRELTPVVYRPKAADVTTLTADLRLVVPEARLAADLKNGAIVAWATAADHEKIRATVDALDDKGPDERGLTPVVYRPKSADVTTLTADLRLVVPEARLAADLKNGAIVAWATPADHEKIRATVDGLDSAGPTERGMSMVVYRPKSADISTLTLDLRLLVPNAGISADIKNGAIVVWATPADHEKIKATVDGVDGAGPNERGLTSVVYRPKSADVTTLTADLRVLVPEARLAADLKNGAIVAWATPADHEKIRATVDGLDGDGPNERGLTSVVYRPKSADVTTLLADLRLLVPEARLAADAKNAALVAWATPADHEKIRATVEGLEAELPAESQREVATYQVANADSATLLAVLQGAVADAKFVPEPKSGAVIAWARPEQHEQLKKAVAGLDRQVPLEKQRIAKVYRFENGDANAALLVLKSLLPLAQLAVDTRTGSLAATAFPREHVQIADIVEQMDGGSGQPKDLELRVYTLDAPDPNTVLTMLRDLFLQRPEVRFSLDSKTAKLVAWAQPSQHKVIEDVIHRVTDAGQESEVRQLEVHKLGDADPLSVTWALKNMFQSEREAKITADEKSGLLSVYAAPSVQASVKAVIEQMQGNLDQVEVMQLETLDPFSARTSIERLFGDPLNRNKPGVPKVEVDVDSGQVLVRANQAQVAQIRQMLVKMGESQLAETSGDPRGVGDRRMRVIPMSERNMRAALDEIQRVWPQLRDNPIRIVTPSAVAPTVQADRVRRESDAANSSDAPADSAPGTATPRPQAQPEGGCESESEAAVETETPPAPATQSSAAHDKKPGPAIVIAPSAEGITISSDDPEALDHFEQLLKTFVQRSAAGGREFTIFNLKRANAVEVAETVQNVLMGSGFGFRGGFGGSTVVPDPRLNAVIVQAGRNEMATIENLIKTLDAEDAPESAISARPKLIQVRNTSAYRIAEILRDVYKAQLTAGGARRQAPVGRPEGGGRMSSEMAMLVQQLNAASTGPEMSIGIDDATNSLIVAAPRNLLVEVEQLVQSLDEQSNAAKPLVRVIALKTINTKTLGKVLDNLIQEKPRVRRSSQ